ncbi:hypothetical protein GCK72_021032 [Caenorhabditis remanei]|uniref:F-box domain-containing protein n=1 Tax=Caenorhabditis remanei TaxID=31234 RepID=A0A6A5GJF9_CAERE|nr:hypothetical protein GCK72_021032 [Caenorhabditis remanei]KAF1754469.1 hypothetical protein GCK72_021032 [Caenorhabditis remanei]
MSTTSALEFSNLPTDAIGKIIEKCDLKEQLTLRKVSKDLRSLVDEQKSAYKSIEIDLMDSCIFCVYNNKDVVYASENWDKNYMPIETSVIRNDDYEKMALNDLSIALKNPKLRLDELELTVYNSPDMMNRFGLLLNSLNHLIHVKTLKVHVGNPEFFLSILPFLKPKVLANIDIDGVYEGDDWALEKVRQVTSLEQWKQAEQLTAQSSFHNFPSEFLMHFKRFVILNWLVDETFLIKLRNLFSTSINFESCTVDSPNVDNFCEFLQSFCEKVESEGEVIYRFKIPDESNKIDGYDAIKFKEFEFWYYRFSRGEFDLDYDVGSIISDLELSNLHNDAIEKIIEKCDLKEQLTLRKVSKDLRSFVDKQKSAYKSIEIDLTGSISCVYNGNRVVYEGENWEVDLRFDYEDSCILASEDYVKIASNDLSFALNNPKLRLDDLAVNYYYNDVMNLFYLKSLLEHMNHQIHVKTLRLYAGSPEYLLSILPFLKPKVLVNIEIDGYDDRDDVSKTIEEIGSLEQWKQAEQLTAQDWFEYFPSECLMHFKRLCRIYPILFD